jgi:hypothetical protein
MKAIGANIVFVKIRSGDHQRDNAQAVQIPWSRPPCHFHR